MPPARVFRTAHRLRGRACSGPVTGRRERAPGRVSHRLRIGSVPRASTPVMQRLVRAHGSIPAATAPRRLPRARGGRRGPVPGRGSRLSLWSPGLCRELRRRTCLEPAEGVASPCLGEVRAMARRIGKRAAAAASDLLSDAAAGARRGSRPILCYTDGDAEARGSAMFKRLVRLIARPGAPRAEDSASADSLLLHIGTTSGQRYGLWDGRVSPAGLIGTDLRGYSALGFDAIEIRASFYHLPKPDTLAHWAEQAPASFRFVLCAPSRI